MIFGGSEQLMNKLITFLGICTTVAILALPAAAHTTIAQDQCSTEGKNALYKVFLDNRKGDQEKAFKAAKDYLACPAGEVDAAQQAIIDYLKKFVGQYEAADKKNQYRIKLYNEKKYPEAYALGKDILSTEPDNLKVLVDLGANGYLLAPLNNTSLNSAALEYAKKALRQIESGKTVESWDPLKSKDEAVAYLNYTVGALSLQSDPANALKNLIKAAQFATPLKESPYTYAYIAGAYETGPYAKMSADYKAMYSGKDETPESKLALLNINQIVDRMIDGYARAVALAGSKADFAQPKAVWNESLTTWYKYRNNNATTGMDQLVAGILSKPLPPEPTPITVLPASTPAATPANNSGTPGTPGNGTASAANTGTAATGGANGGGKTATTTTPAGTKPNGTKSGKPKRNHQ
jgi:tetratricopeptide (TPR) repeat protein